MTLKEKMIINILLSLVEFLGKDVDGFYSHKYIDNIRQLLKESDVSNER